MYFQMMIQSGSSDGDGVGDNGDVFQMMIQSGMIQMEMV